MDDQIQSVLIKKDNSSEWFALPIVKIVHASDTAITIKGCISSFANDWIYLIIDSLHSIPRLDQIHCPLMFDLKINGSSQICKTAKLKSIEIGAPDNCLISYSLEFDVLNQNHEQSNIQAGT